VKAGLNDLERSISEVRRRIREAARRSGREEKEITLVAVSKTVGVEEITRAAAILEKTGFRNSYLNLDSYLTSGGTSPGIFRPTK